MKTFKFLAIFIIFLINSGFTAYAQTPKNTPTPVLSQDERLIDQINNLREKVASKVAELNLVEKRGAIIKVTEINGNKITGKDLKDNIRFIDVDELTKFSSPSAKSFGISDIKNTDTIGVIGLYNKQTKRLLARFIDSISLPVILTGHISAIDKDNYTVTVLSEDTKSTIIDVENVTKTYSFTKENNLVRFGFSKLEVGDRVFAAGYAQPDQKGRISGTRIIDFIELPANPKIKLTLPTAEINTSPTLSPGPTLR